MQVLYGIGGRIEFKAGGFNIKEASGPETAGRSSGKPALSV